MRQPTELEIKTELIEVLNGFPKDMIVFKTTDGNSYTATQMKVELTKGSLLGKEFVRYTMAEAKEILKDGI